MKIKKQIIAFIITVISLIIAIGLAITSNLDDKLKEVKVAKEFFVNLKEKDIIDTELNLNEIEFQSIPKLENINSKIQYTVIAENVAIVLDSNYVVTAFSQKESRVQNKSVLIDENMAIELAEEYVSEITKDKVKFKEIRQVREDEEGDFNSHIVVFYKYFKNYPYYDNEIVVKINKATGKLESYINNNVDDIKHNIKKDINKTDVKNILTDYFSNSNKRVEILENPILAHILNTNEEFILSYVVDVKTTDNDNKKEMYKVFINAETGEVINILNNVIESTESN